MTKYFNGALCHRCHDTWAVYDVATSYGYEHVCADCMTTAERIAFKLEEPND